MSVKIRSYRRGGWEVDISVELPDGTKIRQRKKAPMSSKWEAKRWGEERERALFVQAQSKPRKEVPTLAEFSSRFLQEYCGANRQKASGIERKESSLRIYLLPLFGRKRLDEINNEDVQRVKVQMRDRAPSSVNNVLTTLNKLLKVAVEWGEIEVMPCSIHLLRRPEKEAAYWDFDEFERLERSAESVGRNAQMIVLLGALAGLRMGEIIALRWSDVDLPRRRLWVRQNDWRGYIDTPKGGRSGMVDLCERLGAALKTHQSHSRLRSRDARVMCRDDGTSLTARCVRRLVERSERMAGLPNRGVHALRHTFGAHLATHGASPKAIQELMRHSSLGMTQRYTHLSPAARERAVRLLDHPVKDKLGDILETADFAVAERR